MAVQANRASATPGLITFEGTPLALLGSGDGPLFDWFLDRYAQLDWAIPAGSLGPGLPPRLMRPRQLERFLLEEADYPQRDQIWAAVITGARRTAGAEPYRVLALGLAARGLRGFRDRLPVRHRGELADVDQDLAFGFLRRLESIDVGTTNLGMKLIDSGITHARSCRRRIRVQPLTVAVEPSSTASQPADVHVLFRTLIVELADAGTPLTDQDVTLLAVTGLDGLSVKEAAKRLGIGEQAAYKRRQRAEARIRRHLATRS
ncbi:hypothetical protein Q0Z83_001250 [Actinoplanes sichuanensis]|uniref:ECF-type sigma factor n=1 Tax=Actinoplanes sichuanensis TaxID=512349 RepID=UPI002953A4E2|nr:ECF-type sigma factor [Actinoplanes sichuanensis]BEL01934.1 hypothetical protein Q0Z83_001250 [Actinoplanes sichuanensis]